MMEEVWKDIPLYEGIYQVSNLGRIKRLPRIINKYCKVHTRILKPCMAHGYYLISLSDHNGLKKTYSIHRIVAITFIPGGVGKYVNHINGIKTDNRLENLEWVTNSENNKHAYANGLKIARKGLPRSIPIYILNLKNNYKMEFSSINKASTCLSINGTIIYRSLRTGIIMKGIYKAEYKYVVL